MTNLPEFGPRVPLSSTAGQVSRGSAKRAGIAIGILICISAAMGCGETQERGYPSFVEAEANGAPRRGLLPAVVPSSATDILVRWDIDTGGVRGRFRLSAEDLATLNRSLASLARPTGLPPVKKTRPGVPRWWPAVLSQGVSDAALAAQNVTLFLEGAWILAVLPAERSVYFWTRDH